MSRHQVALFLSEDLFKAEKVGEIKVHTTPQESKRHGYVAVSRLPLQHAQNLTSDHVAPTHKEAGKVEGKPVGMQGRALHSGGGAAPAKPAPEESKQLPGAVPKQVTAKPKTGASGKLLRDAAAHEADSTNKPGYKCKNCGRPVMPRQERKIPKPGPTEIDKERYGREVAAHKKAGAVQIDEDSDSTHTIATHPMKEHKGSGWKPLKHEEAHHAMVAAKVCTKEGCGRPKQIGRGLGGSHEEATRSAQSAAAEKSLGLIDSMLKKACSLDCKSIPDGADFGKPAATVSEEISHLVKDKEYPQKRAVAAALSMQREGKIKKGLGLYLAL